MFCFAAITPKSLCWAPALKVVVSEKCKVWSRCWVVNTVRVVAYCLKISSGFGRLLLAYALMEVVVVVGGCRCDSDDSDTDFASWTQTKHATINWVNTSYQPEPSVRQNNRSTDRPTSRSAVIKPITHTYIDKNRVMRRNIYQLRSLTLLYSLLPSSIEVAYLPGSNWNSS